ncbi:MAG: hypothetical protein ABW352_17120 [Polyangiales bacterium]
MIERVGWLWVLLSLPLASAPVRADAHCEALRTDHGTGAEYDGLAGLGSVQFPIRCEPPAQALFVRAVAMLHSFWYDEAARSFVEVSRLDPGCAMAHWGIAMSLYHPLWTPPRAAELQRGALAVSRARELGGKTRHEVGYIEAIGAFFDGEPGRAHAARVDAYERAMAALFRSDPSDREAATLYSLVLMANADPADKALRAQQRAGVIAGQVFARQPDHPGAAHYVIHAYDYPALAERALAAARAYARIAPDSPHALHMPSHTFTQRGLWRESIDSNIASETSARAYAERTGMRGAWEEQLHAMDYLAYAYLQLGRDDEAAQVLAELRAIDAIEPARSRKGEYALNAVPARYALERVDLAAAARLQARESDFPRAMAVTYFSRGYAHARRHELAAAHADLALLEQARDSLARHSEEGATASELVDVQRLAVAAWIAQAESSHAEARRLLARAADLEDGTDDGPVTPGPVLRAREMLGELLMLQGEPRAALKELKRTLVSAPARLNVLLAALAAARASGQSREAARLQEQLDALCEGPRCQARSQLGAEGPPLR